MPYEMSREDAVRIARALCDHHETTRSDHHHSAVPLPPTGEEEPWGIMRFVTADQSNQEPRWVGYRTTTDGVVVYHVEGDEVETYLACDGPRTHLRSDDAEGPRNGDPLRSPRRSPPDLD